MDSTILKKRAPRHDPVYMEMQRERMKRRRKEQKDAVALNGDRPEQQVQVRQQQDHQDQAFVYQERTLTVPVPGFLAMRFPVPQLPLLSTSSVFAKASTSSKRKIRANIAAAICQKVSEIHHVAVPWGSTVEENRKVVAQQLAIVAKHSFGVTQEMLSKSDHQLEKDMAGNTVLAIKKLFDKEAVTDFKTRQTALIHHIATLHKAGYNRAQIQDLLGNGTKQIKHSKKGIITCLAYAINPTLWAQVQEYIEKEGTVTLQRERNLQKRNQSFQLDQIKKIILFAYRFSIPSAKRYVKLLPNGEKATFPVRFRLISIASMYTRFVLENPGGTISADRFKNIVKCCAQYTTKSLAALDTCSEQHGRRNFEKMIEYLELAKKILPGDQHLEREIQLCNDLIKATELHLKCRENGIWSSKHLNGPQPPQIVDHDTQDCGPASHCMCFLLNKKDKSAPLGQPNTEVCGHVHMTTCLECDLALISVPDKISHISTYVTSQLQIKMREKNRDLANDILTKEQFEEQSKDIQSKITEHHLACTLKEYMFDRFINYYGHQARLMNESKIVNNILIDLKNDPSTIWIVSDYAMKYMLLRYRECMQDFFGKRGMIWLASKVVWWDTEKQKYIFYDINCIPTTSVPEDAKLSMEGLTAILAHHRKVYPEGTHWKLIHSTDGAATFAGSPYLGPLTLLYLLHNWCVLYHTIGEAGGNKTTVDGNIGYLKNLLKWHVKEKGGKGDILCAEDLIRTLQEVKAKYNVTVKLEHSDVKISTKPNPVDGLKHGSLRVFEYYPNHTLKCVKVYNHSGYEEYQCGLDMYNSPDLVVYPNQLYSQQLLLNNPHLAVPKGSCKGPDVPLSSDSRSNIGCMLTKGERQNNEAIKNDRKHNKHLARLTTVAVDKAFEVAREANSKFLKCETAGCCKRYRKGIWLNRHIDGDQCYVSSNPHGNVSTKRKHKPDELFQKSDLEVVSHCILNGIVTNEETSFTFTNRSHSIAVTPFKAGVFNKRRVKRPDIPIDQLQMIRYLVLIGDRTKNTLSEHQMHLILKGAGTKDMATQYSDADSPFVSAFQQSHQGNPIFHPFLIPEAWRIKEAVGQMITKSNREAADKASAVIPEDVLRQLLNDALMRNNIGTAIDAIEDWNVPRVVECLLRNGIGRGGKHGPRLEKVNNKIVKTAGITTEIFTFPLVKRITTAITTIETNPIDLPELRGEQGQEPEPEPENYDFRDELDEVERDLLNWIQQGGEEEPEQENYHFSDEHDEIDRGFSYE